MIQVLRQRHLVWWLMLALILPTLVVLVLLARPPLDATSPLSRSDEAQLLDPTAPPTGPETP